LAKKEIVFARTTPVRKKRKEKKRQGKKRKDKKR